MPWILAQGGILGYSERLGKAVENWEEWMRTVDRLMHYVSLATTVS